MAIELTLDPRALGAAVVLLVVFIGLYLTFAGFQMVGITPGEVIVLFFVAPLVALVNIPLVQLQGVVFGVNLAGAVIPVGMSLWFVSKDRLPAWKAVLGTAAVAAVSYGVASVQPDRGIVVPAFPIVAAALVTGLVLSGSRWHQVGPVTYASGALGVLVGADLLNLPALLDPTRAEPLFAVIGGAGTLDAIFLVSLVAVVGAIVVVGIAKLVGKLE